MTSYVNSIFQIPQPNSNSNDYLQKLFHELPYPLGWRWRQFLYEVEAFERGEESSNFPFLFVSLNGLVVRWLAILFMSEYIQRSSVNNEQERINFLEKIQSPSDGTWKQVMDTLLKRVELGSSSQLMRNLRHKLCENYTFSGTKKGINSLHVMQHFIQLRNYLLHSTRRLDRHETISYIEQMSILFHSLLPLSTGYVIGYLYEKFYIYRGTIPIELNIFGMSQAHTSATRQTNELLPEDQQAIAEWLMSEATKKQGRQTIWFWAKEFAANPISLWPFVCGQVKSQKRVQREFADLVFLNGWSEKHAVYLSYRDSAVYQHDQVGLSQFLFGSLEKNFSSWNQKNIEFLPYSESHQHDLLMHNQTISLEYTREAFEIFWLNLPIVHEFLTHRMLGILSIMPGMATDDFFATLFSNGSGSQKIWLSFDIAQIRQSFNHYLTFRGESYQLSNKEARRFILERFHSEEILWNLLKLWLENFLIHQSPSISLVVHQLSLCLDQVEVIFSSQEKAQFRRQLMDVCITDNSICRQYLSQVEKSLGQKERQGIITLLKQMDLTEILDFI